MKGFKDFIMRGNVVELAVAVVIGAAFGKIVSAFADDFIGGIIAQLIKVNGLEKVVIPGTPIIVGTTITAAINFLIVAAVVYFLIVMPMNKVAERAKRNEVPAEEAPQPDIELLKEIRDLLRARNGGL